MGYTGGRLADLWREEPIRETARRITDRVGEDLRARVAYHTPVASPPHFAVADEWLSERGMRYPGKLKRSWKVGQLDATIGGERMTIDVYTDDPVAPFVEWDCAPHLILPRKPGGVLRFRNRFGDVIFAKVVHHPGTRGAHMMATAIAEVAASWEAIGEEEVDRMAREYWL